MSDTETSTETKTPRKPALSAEAFVRAFVAAHKAGKSVSELAADLDMSTNAIYQRAAQYREKGVKLPTLAKGVGRPSLDVEGLNSLVDE